MTIHSNVPCYLKKKIIEIHRNLDADGVNKLMVDTKKVKSMVENIYQ